MTPIAANLSHFPFPSLLPPPDSASDHHYYYQQLRFLGSRRLGWNRLPSRWRACDFAAKVSSSAASTSSSTDALDCAAAAAGREECSDDRFGKEERKVEVEERNGVDSERKFRSLSEMVANSAPSPAVVVNKQAVGSKFAIGISVAVALLVISARNILTKKNNLSHHGSVADLVRRGQLRSDRRGISKPLKYEDPFNNPFMKVDKGTSSVEMFGKAYRLAPVTLTKEQKSVHQKRRSRAYQWKRPTVFLKEGEPIPPDVDPDTVRWIPANHPFATTTSDIDEDLAQHNVHQNDGVPFRIKAEHEAMQKKLQLQAEQRENEIGVFVSNTRETESASKSLQKPDKQVEWDLFTIQQNGKMNEEIDS